MFLTVIILRNGSHYKEHLFYGQGGLLRLYKWIPDSDRSHPGGFSPLFKGLGRRTLYRKINRIGRMPMALNQFCNKGGAEWRDKFGQINRELSPLSSHKTGTALPLKHLQLVPFCALEHSRAQANIHDLRIEVFLGLGLKIFERLFIRPGFPIRPIGRERIPYICNGEDSR